jgi:hypothetical protein
MGIGKGGGERISATSWRRGDGQRSFQDPVVGEEVTKSFRRSYVKWKGVLRTLFSGHVGRRRGDEKLFDMDKKNGSVVV